MTHTANPANLRSVRRLSRNPWLILLLLLTRILAGDLAFATSSIEPMQPHTHCAPDATSAAHHSSEDCCKHGHSCECAAASAFASIATDATHSNYFPPPLALDAKPALAQPQHLTSAQF